MQILVTGGSGRLGQWVLRTLVGHGHLVVNADRRLIPPSSEAPFLSEVHQREVDVTDIGQVAGAMAGCSAVVHLAAIAGPYTKPDEVVFGDNTRATFAVLRSAMLLGVRKVVIASSGSALGMAWAIDPFVPLYAPVDEEHPLLPQDPYGLSKEVDERTGAMFHRRTGMSVLALRFHLITLPGESSAIAAEAAARPERYCSGLWGYVDVRDAADACRLGVEAGEIGFHVFNVTAADTLGPAPTEELLRRHCPSTEIRRPIPGTATAWSIDKAQAMLRYQPRHSWRG